MNRTIETIRSEVTGESCLHVRHESGLEIYIMEMPGYQTCHALFAMVMPYGLILFIQRNIEFEREKSKDNISK